NKRTPTGRDLAEPNPNARWTICAPAAPTSFWISIISTGRTHHEITSRHTFDRGRGSQDQRQPRRSILERDEGNLRPSRHDAVGTGRRDRQQPPAGKSFLCDPALCVGLFPHPRDGAGAGIEAAGLT